MHVKVCATKGDGCEIEQGACCRRWLGVAGCCRVLQGVAVCCRVIQGDTVRCRVLRCVTGCCSRKPKTNVKVSAIECDGRQNEQGACYSLLQGVAVCCRVLQQKSTYLYESERDIGRRRREWAGTRVPTSEISQKSALTSCSVVNWGARWLLRLSAARVANVSTH